MVRRALEPMGRSSHLEPLVTVAQAVPFLGLQVGAVHVWVETERIPSQKVGALHSLRRFARGTRG